MGNPQIFEIEPTFMSDWAEAGYLLPLNDVVAAIGQDDYVAGSLFAYGDQIVGDNAPTDPSFEAILTAISAASKSMLTLDNADPSFDAGMEASASPEPSLTLMLATLS